MAKAKKQAIPSTALVLGLAGLIPFFGCALAATLFDGELAARSTLALAAYGAVILSFLGGVKWGVLVNDKTSLKRWKPIVLSVIPSIIAWLALLLPAIAMLSVLAAGVVYQYFLDSESVHQTELPEWYGRLRLILTTGAVFSLLVGLIAQVL